MKKVLFGIIAVCGIFALLFIARIFIRNIIIALRLFLKEKFAKNDNTEQ